MIFCHIYMYIYFNLIICLRDQVLVRKQDLACFSLADAVWRIYKFSLTGTPLIYMPVETLDYR